MNDNHPLYERLDHGISVVDTGFQRPRFDSAYLVVQDGRAAIIETGTNHSVQRFMQALREHGLGPEAVDWVIVTHVHLDHAGGAGLLVQQLPNAKLAVHPRGARHMVDPAQLWAGVCAVYGADVAQRDYGRLVPVPQERVVTVEDEGVLHLGTRPLRFIDTPGHAKHHFCIWDEASRGWFTGDTLGISYEELRPAGGHYAFPSTTPVQFDPEGLRSSLDRLLATRPRVAYLTHYGAVKQVEEQARQVLDQAGKMVAIAQSGASGAALRQQLGDLYFGEAAARGLRMPRSEFDAFMATDVELNAQGLEVWMKK